MAAKFRAFSVMNLLAAKIFRAPLWLMLSALYARVLGPDGLGTWSMILAAAMFLNQVLLHWTQAVTQRYGRKEWLDSNSLGRTLSLRFVLLVPGLTLLMLLLLIQPFNWPVRFYGLNSLDAWFILPMVTALWIMAEVQGLQQVREEFGRMAWSPLFADLMVLGALAILAWHFHGVAQEHLGVIFGVLLLTGVIVWFFFLAVEARGISFYWYGPDRLALREAAYFAVPMIPGVMIGYISEWSDYFLIRYFYNETEVGFFHPAYQYLLIIIGLPTALSAVVLPKLIAVHDFDGGFWMRNLLERRVPQLGVLWGGVGLSISAILPALFLYLVGGRYENSAAVLQIMAIAIPGAVYQHIYTAACFAQNRLWMANLVFFGIKFGVSLGLSVFLLPKIGIIGSALSCGISYIVLQWTFVIDQNKFLKLKSENIRISLVFVQLAGIFMAFTNDLLFRVLVAAISILALVIWARRNFIFTADEISVYFPVQYNIHEKIKRMLCARAQ